MAQNYTIKMTLQEAVSMRAALNEYKRLLGERIGASAPGDMTATREEYNRVEKMIREL